MSHPLQWLMRCLEESGAAAAAVDPSCHVIAVCPGVETHDLEGLRKTWLV